MQFLEGGESRGGRASVGRLLFCCAANRLPPLWSVLGAWLMQKTVEMLKLPKDMMLSLYSLKINSSSSSPSFLLLCRIYCSLSHKLDVLLILKFTSRNFWLKKKKPAFCGRYTDAYRFTASTLFLFDNWICFAHLFLCFTCGWLCLLLPKLLGRQDHCRKRQLGRSPSQKQYLTSRGRGQKLAQRRVHPHYK